jgi:putative ABC transport system permease protein
MSALSRVVRSGVSRRWVQTVVITLATAAAVTSGVLGVGLLVASNAPFDHAFVAQHGAHLTVLTDPAKATAAQLGATAEAAGVTEASGPFATAQVMVLPGLPPGETEPPPGRPGPGPDRRRPDGARIRRRPGDPHRGALGDAAR